MRRKLTVVVVATLTLAGLIGLAPPAGSVAGFGDVPGGAFFAKPVQWMVDKGITQGTTPECFSPSDPVTRGQAAAFLWRMEGREQAPAHRFVDASAPWVRDAVSWLSAEGITKGTTATTFSPDAALTRGQMAALLHRLAGTPAASRPGQFPDVVEHWMFSAVGWLVDEGITNGTTPSTFSPGATVTRGELAAFLYRYKGSPRVTVDSAQPACGGSASSPSTPGSPPPGGNGPPSSWPDASTTGVTNAGVLKDSGSVRVTRDGTVVQNLRVDGQITIEADNVTVRNVHIVGSAKYGIKVDPDTSGTLIEDVTIIGGNAAGRCDIGIVYGHFTARRVEITRCGDGIRAGSNTVFEDNWIHDMRDLADDHSDGIQSIGGTNLVLRHNNIEMCHCMTSAMILHAHLGGPLRDVLVEDNLIAGGGYTLNIKDRTEKVSDVTVRDNVWVSDSWNFGTHQVDVGSGVMTWSGNVETNGSRVG